MVALRSPRRPATLPTAPPEVEVEPPPVVTAAQPPPSDTPMADNLEQAAAEIPFPPQGSGPDVSALQAQIAAQKQAEEVQRQAFEQQRQIAAAMQIEKTQPKELPKLSERDLEWLGARPNVQADPTFNQSVQALAHVYKYGSPAFYEAMSLRYPVSDFRRVEPRQEELAAAAYCGTEYGRAQASEARCHLRASEPQRRATRRLLTWAKLREVEPRGTRHSEEVWRVRDGIRGDETEDAASPGQRVLSGRRRLMAAEDRERAITQAILDAVEGCASRFRLQPVDVAQAAFSVLTWSLSAVPNTAVRDELIRTMEDRAREDTIAHIAHRAGCPGCRATQASTSETLH